MLRPMTTKFFPVKGLPPEVKRRFTFPSLIGGVVVGVMAFVGSWLFLSILLPKFGLLPIEEFPLKHLGLLFYYLIDPAHGTYGAYFEKVFYSGTNQKYTLITLWFGATTISIFAGWLAFKSTYVFRDGYKHNAGRQLLEGELAIKKIQSRLKQYKGEPGLQIHQDFNLPRSLETTHMLLIGGPGSGKTSILYHILNDIWKRNDKCILVDVKGDFTAVYDGIIFNPLDPLGRHWDIAKDINTDELAEAFANQIIPEMGGDNQFFSDAARQSLTAVIIKFQKKKPGQWTFKDIYDEVGGDDAHMRILDSVIEHNPTFTETIKDSGKQTQAVLSTLQIGFSLVKLLVRGEENYPKAKRFSITDWAKDDYKGKRQIILGGVADLQELCVRYIGLFLEVAAKKLLAKTDNKDNRYFLCIDEFPQLGKIRSVKVLMDVGRSKGVGVILAFQDFLQVYNTYGENEGRSILNVAGTRIFGKVGDSIASEICKEYIGERSAYHTKKTQSASGSSSTTDIDKYYPIVANDFQNLGLTKEEDGILAVFTDAEYIYTFKWSFVAPPKIRAAIYDRLNEKAVEVIQEIEEGKKPQPETQKIEQVKALAIDETGSKNPQEKSSDKELPYAVNKKGAAANVPEVRPVEIVDVSQPPVFEEMASEGEDLEDEEAPPDEGEGATKPIIHEEAKDWGKPINKKSKNLKELADDNF